MGEILTIRQEKAPRNKSEWCEIVVRDNGKTLDMVFEGEMAEHNMKSVLGFVKSEYATYGYDAAKELMEQECKFPPYRKCKRVELFENNELIAKKVSAK